MSDQEPRPGEPTPPDSGGPSQPTPGGGAPPPPPPPSGAGAAPQQPAAQAATGYGGAGIRLGARIIDGLIVAIPLAIVFAIIPGLDVGGDINNVVSSLVGLGYFVYLETTEGATFGKKILNLRVAAADGASPIDTDASLRRNWWLLLGVLAPIPILGWLASLASLGVAIAIGVTISGDELNRGFHDQMASTTVLRT